MLVNFIASNFEGTCLVDNDFVPYLRQMNTLAQNHKMIIVVTSSFRKDTTVKGAIVTPAKKGNHLVGHAIDCNLKSLTTKEYFNSTKMGDGKGPDELFIKDVETHTQLRWGGRFNDKDEVHFDDGLNLRNPAKWLAKYKELHV